MLLPSVTLRALCHLTVGDCFSLKSLQYYEAMGQTFGITYRYGICSQGIRLEQVGIGQHCDKEPRHVTCCRTHKNSCILSVLYKDSGRDAKQRVKWLSDDDSHHN